MNGNNSYQKTGYLGEGMYAQAHLATHEGSIRPIVVKEYHPHVVRNYDAYSGIRSAFHLRQRKTQVPKETIIFPIFGEFDFEKRITVAYDFVPGKTFNRKNKEILAASDNSPNRLC